jgi:EmrB/QacA subfamily drug resistance transporter
MTSVAAKPGRVLGILSLAAFMASLDLFIVNVAFPDIGRDFGGQSLSNLSWILNGYAVLYAALLVPLGRLADRYGRLNGFLGGLALFTLASAACAASQDLWSLVAFRGLQAVGAAALTPTSLGLLLASTPKDRKVRAVRIWSALGALAAAFGPVVGGLLVQASWRWVFIVNLPVGVATLIVARRVVPDSRDLTVQRTPDLLGAAFMALGIGALALALVKGEDWGWSSSYDVVAFVVAAIGLVAFWTRSSRHPLPVIEPALLRVRTFAWANVTTLLFMVAFGGSMLAMVLWLQNVWHYSALRTGLAIAPGPFLVVIVTTMVQRFGSRLPLSALAAAGCAVYGLGIVVVASSVGAAPAYATEIVPGWLIGGLGVGLALPSIMSSATTDLPPARTATGSAAVLMSRQIGLTLGVALFIAVLGFPHGYAAVHAGFREAWWALAVATWLGALTALGMTPRRVQEARLAGAALSGVEA